MRIKWSLILNRIASAALAAACIFQAWRRGGMQVALAIAFGVAVLLAMIWFGRFFAAGMPRRGSTMLGAPDAHHVEPVIYTLLGWGLLIFVTWVAYSPR